MPALVLLSGGVDSVAALHWSKRLSNTVRALHIFHGQLASQQEKAAASRAAAAAGVEIDVQVLVPSSPLQADMDRAMMGPPAPGVDEHGVSLANVPARNALFLAFAAQHAGRIAHVDKQWRSGVSIVIGCNVDDAVRFPDCRPEFISRMSDALSLAMQGVIGSGQVLSSDGLRVRAPWLEGWYRKSEIVKWARREGLTDELVASYSCYAGAFVPCGTCDACTLRDLAFHANALELARDPNA